MEYNAQCKVCGVARSRRVDAKISGAVRGAVLTPRPGAKYCFVVNFNPFSLSRQTLLDFLDTQPDVLNWIFSYALHGQVILVPSVRFLRSRAFSGQGSPERSSPSPSSPKWMDGCLRLIGIS